MADDTRTTLAAALCTEAEDVHRCCRGQRKVCQHSWRRCTRLAAQAQRELYRVGLVIAREPETP